MDIYYLFKAVIRKSWILILVPLIALAVAYLFTKNLPDKYLSSAQLATGITTGSQIQLSNQRFNYMESVIKFNNITETMKSEMIVSMVSYKLLLHDIREVPFRANSLEGLPDLMKTTELLEKKLETFTLLDRTDSVESQVIASIIKGGYVNWILLKNFIIKRVNDTDFIRVEYISENAILSAFVVNTLAEEFIRYDKFQKVSSSGESFDYYENLVAEKKKEMDDKNDRLDNYKEEAQIFNYDVEAESKLAQITSYEHRALEESKSVQALRITLANVNARIAGMQSSERNKANNSKILELRSKIKKLNQLYIEGGSNDSELEASLDVLRSQLQIEMTKLQSNSAANDMGKSLEELKAEKNQYQLELDIARSSLASVYSTLTTLKSSVSSIGSKESALIALSKEAENASVNYLKAVDKFNEVKNKAILAESPIKLIVRGQPNGHPESSKSIIIMGLAGFASFALCLVVIVGLEFIDSEIKTPSRFENFSRLKLSGYLNLLDKDGVDLVNLFKQENLGKDLENYKHLLRKIRHEVEESSFKKILVTSTKQSEGKTFMIISLAYSLSLLEKKILIIDTNFKNNSLSKQLIMKNGEQKVLQEMTMNNVKLLKSGDETESEDKNNFLDGIITKTEIKNIDVVGCRIGLESPSEIFAGKNFKTMLQQLGSIYDYILLEGASLNDFSDAKELVQYVDKVLPVFSAKSSFKSKDIESIKYLKSLNGKLMGSILNKVNSKYIEL